MTELVKPRGEGDNQGRKGTEVSPNSPSHSPKDVQKKRKENNSFLVLKSLFFHWQDKN